MNLGTAASIGMGLLQHSGAVNAAVSRLPGAIGALTGAGKGLGTVLGGKTFGKIFNGLHLGQDGDKLGQEIKNALNAGVAGADPSVMNSVQGLRAMNFYDIDRNGEVTSEELVAGLQKITDSNLGSTFDGAKLKAFGEQALKKYDQVARLDGNAAAISFTDYGRLAMQDNKIATLSPDDWNFLKA